MSSPIENAIDCLEMAGNDYVSGGWAISQVVDRFGNEFTWSIVSSAHNEAWNRLAGVEPSDEEDEIGITIYEIACFEAAAMLREGWQP